MPIQPDSNDLSTAYQNRSGPFTYKHYLAMSADGRIFDNGKAALITADNYSIQIGCAKVELAAIKKLLKLHEEAFCQKPQRVLQHAS